MKYTAQEYVNCNFYGEPGEGVHHYGARVIRINKDRKCVNCRKKVKSTTHMLVERAILTEEGRRTAYTCLPCLDKWIDQTKTH